MTSSVAKKVAEGMGLGDYLFLPLAPRQGGSVAASLASAAVLGAGAGVAADFAAGRLGLNDPSEDPRDARRRRLRRGLYGAAIGLGTSALTNLATYTGSANWRRSDSGASVPGPWSKDLHGPPEKWRINRENLLGSASPHLSWFKRAPVESGLEPLTTGALSQKLVVPQGSTPTSRLRARADREGGPIQARAPQKTDLPETGKKKASIRVSDNELKRMVMADPAIPFHTKRILFSQIDDATRGRGRSAAIDTIAHYGGGAIAGYFSAVAAGAGPVQRGISAVVGAMIGGAVLSNKRSDDWTYTPGFRTYP